MNPTGSTCSTISKCPAGSPGLRPRAPEEDDDVFGPRTGSGGAVDLRIANIPVDSGSCGTSQLKCCYE